MMRGLRAEIASYPTPSRFAAAGRMLWTKTSAVSTSRNSASRPGPLLRSSVMLRLLRLTARCIADMPLLRRGPVSRFGSPAGDSTLITSAPMSPRIWVASGPSTLTVRSTTRTPASGPLGWP